MTVLAPDVLAGGETSRSTGDPSWWRRVARGGDAPWARPALVVLLAATAVLYLWSLGASGYANSFYSAAVQAGSTSWKAMFFGSFDSSSFITVDKPPAALWVMDISARLFGVNSWSILVPQALEGVAAVGLLYATVRRRFSAAAALLAGATLALTPVATLMFRFNNPDSLLVLLLVGSAYAVTRALEDGRTRWLVLAGALVGFGFLTKMLQAMLVVPGFGLVYLGCGPARLRRRLLQLLAAGVSLVVAAGWWVAAVTLTPASARPYVGGSTDNSVLQLAFGYNGFGRLTGNETGSVGGGGGGGGAGGTGRWGTTGITRLFGSDMGSQIAWLLPAALLLGLAVLWLTRRLPRSDGQRAQVLLWGSWLVVTGVTLSLGKGIIHPYYTVALAPAIAALVGIGAVMLWRERERLVARVMLAVTLAVTASWSFRLLDRSPTWHPWLRDVVLVVGLIVAVAVVVPPRRWGRVASRAGVAVATAGVLVALAGPAAYSLDTASTPHTGAIPSAGPTVRGAGFGGPGGQRPGGFGAGRRAAGRRFGARHGLGGFGLPLGGFGQRPGGGAGGAPGARGGAGAGGGGLLNAGTVDSATVSALRADASSYTWVAATVGAENASGYQLAAGQPVMAIGGFNGTDQTPSLAEFESLVSQGRVHYFIASGGFGGGGGGQQGGSSDASQIQSWVESHFAATTVGGTTLYDLTQSTSGTAST
jgi:4-amino-4-deoxy-L-arabinose transferase-like glycosyltransferase